MCALSLRTLRAIPLSVSVLSPIGEELVLARLRVPQCLPVFRRLPRPIQECIVLQGFVRTIILVDRSFDNSPQP